MTPVEKALWYIESRFREPITLRDIAKASGVSNSYLIRSFSRVIGMSVIKYMKARRLSEAAKALAAGAPDILSVAIMTGYQSHEAFSRAIREYFNVAPSEIRDLDIIGNLQLVEPFTLDAVIPVPRDVTIHNMSERHIIGFSKRFNSQSKAMIPSLWHELDQYLDRKNGQLGLPAYGVCSTFEDDGTFDYLCGLDIDSSKADWISEESLPLRRKTVIPRGKYAAFPHNGHISSIRNSWRAIYNSWPPSSDFQLANTPEFELYSGDFDPVASTGTVKLFIPLRAA